MIPPFQDHTVRSADDLLADLTLCRQLRHVSTEAKAAIADEIFGDRTYRYVWMEDAFALAFVKHGYGCDLCDAVISVDERVERKVAQRALSNLDGLVKLMLCYGCSRKFSKFTSWHFNREARVAFTPELERMMLAFVAHHVARLCRRFMKGQPLESPYELARREAANANGTWPPPDVALQRAEARRQAT